MLHKIVKYLVDFHENALLTSYFSTWVISIGFDTLLIKGQLFSVPHRCKQLINIMTLSPQVLSTIVYSKYI